MWNKSKKILLWIVEKWFDIVASGGSVIGTWKIFKLYLPSMNVAYIWLICWAVGLITIIMLPLRYKFKNKRNKDSSMGYIETWFEFQCNDKICKYIRDSNVHEMKKLGSYMVYYQDPTGEIQVEFIVGFKEPICIDMYRVDILKTAGIVENPYTVFCYPITDIQGASNGVIIRIGNIGLDDATYRISFLKK